MYRVRHRAERWRRIARRTISRDLQQPIREASGHLLLRHDMYLAPVRVMAIPVATAIPADTVIRAATVRRLAPAVRALTTVAPRLLHARAFRARPDEFFPVGIIPDRVTDRAVTLATAARRVRRTHEAPTVEVTVAASRVRAIARVDTAVARAAVTVEEATAAGAFVAAIPVGPVVDRTEEATPAARPVVGRTEAATPAAGPMADRTEAATPVAADTAVVAATPAQARAIRGTETSAPSAA